MEHPLEFQKFNWNKEEKKLLKELDVWRDVVEEMVTAKEFCVLYTGKDITLLESFMWTKSIKGYDFWCTIDDKLDELKGF